MVHNVAEVLELEKLVTIVATKDLVLSELNISKYFEDKAKKMSLVRATCESGGDKAKVMRKNSEENSTTYARQ